MNEAIEISQAISDSQERLHRETLRLEAAQQAGHAILYQLWNARAEIERLHQVIADLQQQLHVQNAARD